MVLAAGFAATLPGRDREYLVDIPAGRLGEVLSPARARAQAPLPDLLMDAFLHPCGRPCLAELITPGKKLLIIVDDHTRLTPTREVVPVLLAYLAQAGCRPENITFAVALGTHRRMTSAEIELKLGQDVAVGSGGCRRYPVINDPAQTAGVFVATGEFFAAGDGAVPIEVHRSVLDSDLVIGIGSVAPHTEAGWSGGCKMILPGMCSERTVMANHRLAASGSCAADHSGNALGQDTTPVRRNMEEIVARIGFGFSLNLVVAPQGEIVGVYGGDFVAAQRAAVHAARPIFSVPYHDRADVVIANAYPADVDFWQASKGIWAGELLVKPGGTVILHAACPEGIGPHPDYIEFMQREPAQLASDMANGAIDQTAAGLALPVARMLGHMRLVVVSPGLPFGSFGDGPIRPADSLAGAVEAALNGAGPDVRVSVLTHGGTTYPVPGKGSPPH